MSLLRFAAAGAVFSVLFSAGAGFAADKAVKGRQVASGEVIVKYRQGVTENERAALHGRHCSERIREYRHLGMARLKVREGRTVEDSVRELSCDPDVEYAEPNYIVHGTVVPADSRYSSLWGMKRIAAPAAWDVATGNGEVVVAVIDSGVDYNHPDLQANMWVNETEANGKPGVDDDRNGYVDDIHGCNAVTGKGDPMDDNSHGTHVAGTIGAVGNNAVGVSGVSWNVKIVACKFLRADGSGSTADAIECLDYVRDLRNRGVKVVATNNSWGGGGPSRALAEAIDAQRDILFISAAGNETTDNDGVPAVQGLLDLPNVISVASTTTADALSMFSNYGRRSVHIGAPGSNIMSTMPGSAYGYKSGTSMAAPHVTGLAALIKSRHPGLDWRGIRNLLLSSADPAPGVAGKTVTGRRLNAYAALTCVDSRLFAALSWPETPEPGTPAVLSAISANCDSPLGPVTVELAGGEVVELQDDGTAPDVAEGDGIFTARFTPVRRTETFGFSSPAGSELIGELPLPVAMTTSALHQAEVGVAYTHQTAATFGVAPFTWSASGLPSGLKIDAAKGTVSGTPTVAGRYPVAITVTDARGSVDGESLVLDVAPPAKADLLVTQVVSPPSVLRAQPATFSVTVKNQGQTPAGPFVVTFYFSGNGTIVRSDVKVKDVKVSGLAAGEETTVSVAANVPKKLRSGYSYYIGAIADRTRRVKEATEANNAASGTYASVN